MTAPFDRLRGLLAAGGTKTLEGVKGRPSVLQGLQAMYKAGGVRSFFQVWHTVHDAKVIASGEINTIRLVVVLTVMLRIAGPPQYMAH